ncbi:MAG: DUF1987 domain-containing protein [Spirochaetales bacterium]|nr:DUF1987 domain-containing protein [Spirochaetales bacterium]
MIDIPAGKSTPRIFFDEENSTFVIEGQSYPENSSNFYEPVIRWVEDYLSNLDVKLKFKIKLLYINTSSTKAMFYLFDILEDAYINGKDISIEWYYDKENEMAKDTGIELLEDFGFPFNIIEIAS